MTNVGACLYSQMYSSVNIISLETEEIHHLSCNSKAIHHNYTAEVGFTINNTKEFRELLRVNLPIIFATETTYIDFC